MQNHVEINVTKDGEHLFATAARSGTRHLKDIDKLIALIEEKFPESEGYTVTATFWSIYGQRYEPTRK